MKHSDKKRVFICSRFAGDVVRNTAVAMALCRMAADKGHAPFAPHLLYTRFLDDDVHEERESGIGLGLLFMEVCHEVWVYTGDGISDGMQRELRHARLLEKAIVEIKELLPCHQR